MGSSGNADECRHIWIIAALLQREVSLVLGFFQTLGLCDDASGGNTIAVFHLYQTDALSGAARLADFAGLNANDLAVLGDDHQLGVVLHRKNVHHLADLGSGLDQGDDLGSASGTAILADLGALAETVFRDGEDQRLFNYDLDTYDI